MLFIDTSQMLSGVKFFKGAKKSMQPIWNTPVSEVEFEDKRMLMGKEEKLFRY